jgi:hypothetical protein
MKTLATLAIALSLALLASACGQREQVTQFKQGTYQGKPDTPPYQNAPFNGDKGAWERQLATRAQNQNEYKRTH